MDSRIETTTVYKTPDGKKFDTEQEAELHLISRDNDAIIQTFADHYCTKLNYSEKHKTSVISVTEHFLGWLKQSGREIVRKEAPQDEAPADLS